MKRIATVIWKGTGKEGAGTISTQSNHLSAAPYSWNSRFEDKPGTNPEELLGAAHAACFTMKLSFLLTAAGFPPERLETTAEVHLDKDVISHSHLVVKASVPEIGEQQFENLAENAKTNCMVSKALNMDITLDARLLEHTQVRPMD
ncbi:MAG: OsmC family protein [Bacteroidia bacterium]